LNRDDKHRGQSAVDKLLNFVRNNGNKTQLKKALEVQLPTGPVYSFLEGRLPHPSHTYKRLAEITEEEERERINKEIGERRTRLGARKDQVTAEVKREVYCKSQLESLYENLINWTEDDALRREYEEKLLRRAYDTLLVLVADRKKEKRVQVMRLAHGMVVIKHPYTLAWDIELEWADLETVGEMDVGVLREYIAFFPERGLSLVMKAYLSSEVSPFPPPPPQTTAMMPDASEDEDDEPGGVSLTGVDALMQAEDRLVVMSDGLADAKQSVLAHRLMAEYYAHLEEDESTVETVRTGLKILETEAKKSGLKMLNTFDALNNLLASALIRYQSPKNHPEAKTLFEKILKRKPTFTPALIGSGLILEEEEEYADAIDYLSKALKRDPSNARIGAELAWCKALHGDLNKGLKELEKYLAKMDPQDPKMRDTRAETLYRIGKCYWEIDPSRESRKDRKGPYAQFLASIKTNISYAPAYSALGFYYEDYARDKKRARQCFQKAFDLSGSEVLAAERLARSYADAGDWDIVEIIAQRVVDSGKVRQAPGSKKKGISWPYSALGVVQINKQQYQQAIVSFLAALRISPDDYHSYIGLGESYHNSGRYNSSLRTFNYAENPEDGVVLKKAGERWFAKYMLANVNRELGNYDEAIESYENVLKERPKEFGVEIALLQTLLERGWRAIETGFFGRAIDSANLALEVATSVAEHSPNAFNLWKAVADACFTFSMVQERLSDLPISKIQDLLEKSFDTQKYKIFADIDSVGPDTLDRVSLPAAEDASENHHRLVQCLEAAILAQKRSIVSCSHDIHAKAVAWYNLGWTEYRAHVCLEQRPDTQQSGKAKKKLKFLKAAIRCFKRAIELEAGNSEFWNALGVVTTQLNPKVAQHSFVRALHLNERDVKAWTNLGTLYLLQNDHELAHKAFTRAQSTDPDYAHAWVGEGLVALIYGDPREALLHFTHAFEISDSSSAVTKSEYAAHSFDQLASSSSTLSSTLDLIRPLFALRQLHALRANDEPFDHLSALYNERTGSHTSATQTLTALCNDLEAEFERSESPVVLARFANAKADLARNELATHYYASAATDAETALDLTAEEDDAKTMPSEMRRKIRLSAHLTIGLAQHYQHDMDAALAAFRAALEESGAAAEVVCFLAEVLWAKGGEEERSVAREQLFNCVEKHPEHVGAVVLLGVMAAIDGDEEAMDAVREELETFRVSEGLSEYEALRVERVLEAIVELSPSTADAEGDAAAFTEIQKTVSMYPWKPTGWTRLADVSGAEYPANMALNTAERCVPPRGTLGAEGLAGALANTATIADMQRAIVMAPWKGSGWEALAEAVR
jgi:superkiller protein 3